MNVENRRRGRHGRLWLGLLMLAVFAGHAQAASLSASWTSPASSTAAPGTTVDWILNVASDGATAGPTSFTVTYTPNNGAHQSDPLTLGTVTTTAGPGALTCGKTAALQVTCTGISFTGAGSHTVTIPMNLPGNYIPSITAGIAFGSTAVGDAWAPTSAKSITSQSGQSNLYGNANFADATNDHVAAGATLELPFTIFNQTPSGAADHVRVTVNALGNLTIVGATGGTVVSGLGTGSVDLNLGTIASSATASFGVIVKGGNPGRMNFVNVSVRSTGDGMSDGPLRPFGPFPSYQVQVTDGTVARLRMMQVDGTDWLPGPGPFTHVVAIRNEGPDALSLNGRLALRRFVDGTITAARVSTGGGCGPDPALGTGGWSCDLGTHLASGTTVTVTVDGVVTTSPTIVATGFELISNSYTGSSGISGPSINVSTQVDPNQADLQITASHAATAAPGAQTPVTLMVRNAGTIPATDVTLDGRLLSNATLASAPAQCLAGRVFRCELGTIPPGGATNIVLNLVGGSVGSRATFSATVSSTAIDYLMDNNTVQDGFDVASPQGPAPLPPAAGSLPTTIVATVAPFPLTRISMALKTGIPATVRPDRAGTALVRVYIPAATARTVFGMKTAKGPVLIASGKRAAAANASTTVRALLTPLWKKRLASRTTPLAVQQRIDVSAPGSTTRTILRTIRLR